MQELADLFPQRCFDTWRAMPAVQTTNSPSKVDVAIAVDIFNPRPL
jgi:hypothetical protein